MQHDLPDAKPKGHLANVTLNERNFRSLAKLNTTKSGWLEWDLQSECDVAFADFTWAFEKQ